jgi:hypothetical protein
LHPAAGAGASNSEEVTITTLNNGTNGRRNFPKPPGVAKSLTDTLIYFRTFAARQWSALGEGVQPNKKKRKKEEWEPESTKENVLEAMKKFGTYQEEEIAMINGLPHHPGSASGSSTSVVDIRMFPFHAGKLFVDSATQTGYIATTQASEAAYIARGYVEHTLVLEGLKEHEVGITRGTHFQPPTPEAQAHAASAARTFPIGGFGASVVSRIKTYADVITAVEKGLDTMTPLVDWSLEDRRLWKDPTDKNRYDNSNMNFLNILKDYIAIHTETGANASVDGKTKLAIIRATSRKSKDKDSNKLLTTVRACAQNNPLTSKLTHPHAPRNT